MIYPQPHTASSGTKNWTQFFWFQILYFFQDASHFLPGRAQINSERQVSKYDYFFPFLERKPESRRAYTGKLKKKKTLVNKNFLRLVVLLPSLIYTTPGCLCHLYVGWEHVIESCPCWMIYREEKISIVHWTSWDENRVPSWDQSWVPSWNEGWVPSWDGVGYHRI